MYWPHAVFGLLSGPSGNSKVRVGRPAAYYTSRAGYTTTIYGYTTNDDNNSNNIRDSYDTTACEAPRLSHSKTKWMNPVSDHRHPRHTVAAHDIYYYILYCHKRICPAHYITTLAFLRRNNVPSSRAIVVLCVYLYCAGRPGVSAVVINGQTTVVGVYPCYISIWYYCR